MKNVKSILSLLLIGYALGACSVFQKGAGSNKEKKTMYVAGYQVEGMGIAPQKCLVTRESPEEDWSLFYNAIQGFDYEPGYDYVLEVEVSKVENPPADASSLAYTLKEVVTKTKMAIDHSKLNKEWKVTLLNGKAIPENVKTPVIRINTDEGRVSGNTSCNNYNGNVELEDDSFGIKFGKIMSTRMFCPDSVEPDFMQVMDIVDGYHVMNDNIYLYAKGKTVIVGKKAE